uniref:CCHC-type domain-containing protein n=1 Tax=Ditylenchus dipsaci TaxID=166011 RepID=A0A915DQE8_9BILA
MSQSVPQPTDSSTKASTDPSKHFRKCSSCGEHGHFALDCEDIRYQNYGVSQNEGHKFLKESATNASSATKLTTSPKIVQMKPIKQQVLCGTSKANRKSSDLLLILPNLKHPKR